MKMNIETEYRQQKESERAFVKQIADFLISAYDQGEVLTSFTLEKSDGMDFPALRKCICAGARQAERVIWQRDILRGNKIFYPRKVPAKPAMFVKILSKKLVEERFKNGKC